MAWDASRIFESRSAGPSSCKERRHSEVVSRTESNPASMRSRSPERSRRRRKVRRSCMAAPGRHAPALDGVAVALDRRRTRQCSDLRNLFSVAVHVPRPWVVLAAGSGGAGIGPPVARLGVAVMRSACWRVGGHRGPLPDRRGHHVRGAEEAQSRRINREGSGEPSRRGLRACAVARRAGGSRSGLHC